MFTPMNRLNFYFVFFLLILIPKEILEAQPAGTPIDGVVAVVGKHMIKQSEIEIALLQAKSNKQDISECEVLESMLLNKILLHRAEVDSLTVSDEQVEREMDSRIQSMLGYYGTKENLEKQFGKTTEQIKEQFFDLIRENILTMMQQQRITDGIKITPEEVAEYFNAQPQDSIPTIDAAAEIIQIVQYPVVTERDKQSVRKKMEEYRERISQGTKMSTLATLYSEDPGSSKRGGELGFFGKGQMVEPFEDAAFALNTPDEISPVIETRYGYHIIQLIEKRGNQINCRHILLQPKASAETIMAVEHLLDSVANLLRDRKISIQDAVQKYSQDSSKVNGGYMLNPYDNSTNVPLPLLKELLQENAANIVLDNMQAGDVSNPMTFQSEAGLAYRILYVKHKTNSHKMNLTQDYDKIYNLVLSNAKTTATTKWIKNILPSTYIRLNKKYKDCSFQLPWNQ